MDRKDFLQNLGRVSILGGLALTTGFIISRRKVSADKCTIHAVCKDCKEYRICAKDQALKQRIDERKEKA